MARKILAADVRPIWFAKSDVTDQEYQPQPQTRAPTMLRAHIRRLCILSSLYALSTAASAQTPDASDWGYYGGDTFGQRYSGLEQINRDNVKELEVAWTYRTGEFGDDFASSEKLTFEATPILAFDLLYLTTATNIVIALDPSTGAQHWRHDPHIDREQGYSEVTARGVSAWVDSKANLTMPCSRRIFTGTLDARLIALDAMTGVPCKDFGNSGVVDLSAGVRITARGNYLVTSPPAIHGDVVIVGSAINDNQATNSERGVIRAFDARNGSLRWSFDPIPNSAVHPAAKHWRTAEAQGTGGANAWTIMSVDPDRGLVFVPTGSASPDFFGGKRVGNNLFANSLLALDTATGRVQWHQQLVHHDLWDYDLAAQPALAELGLKGRVVPAVIQATKQGMLFVLDRDSGEPVFPVQEVAVPKSSTPGEVTAPTQPFSALPPLTTQSPISPEDAWGITFWDRRKCRKLIEKYRNEGIFTPPDLRGTIMLPSYAGGVNWGGVAVDVRRERVIAAVNHIPMVVTLVPQAQLAQQAASGQYPHSEFARQRGTPYGLRREMLMSPLGLPCTRPPWGTLVAVDLRTQRIEWQAPLGSTEGQTPWYIPDRDFGMPHMGGPIATSSDLVFIGAAMDGYLRAFDLETGRELWKHRLPAGGQATPMTYRAGSDQRQFVVISAGGHGRLGTPRGDYVVAFALPAESRKR